MLKKPCIAANEAPVISETAAQYECYRKIKHHPCFSEMARHKYGRMHLAVAPECQVQCNYCHRCYDCVNESRPGVTSELLTPTEALTKVREVVAKFPFIRVIGIAGPGEPLCNKETFAAFGLIREEFPQLKLCVSTNGLALPDKLDLLDELGVDTITVTISTIDPYIGKEIYAYVNYQGKHLQGLEAAEVLLHRQLAGVKGAVDRGFIVKVNTVLIPSVNDECIVDLAKKLRKLKVYMMNIMPLLPQPNTKFGYLRRPSTDERKRVQDECAVFIRQMSWCRQCRADAVGLLGHDLTQQVSETCQSNPDCLCD